MHKGGAELYLIVGLGNPGREYEKTRHNVGFQVVDLLADRYKISLSRTKFKSVYGETSINGKKIILAKPQTFMNCSGESVAEITRFYKIPTEKVIVIYDDMSLEIGRLRIRPKGSAGGHNGIKYYSPSFLRGIPKNKNRIGKPKESGLIMFSEVLAKRKEKLLETYKIVFLAVETIITKGTDEAMNKYNSFKI